MIETWWCDTDVCLIGTRYGVSLSVPHVDALMFRVLFNDSIPTVEVILEEWGENVCNNNIQWTGKDWEFNVRDPFSPVYKTEINGRGDSLRWPRDTLYPLPLALTSSPSGGLSVGIVRWRTEVPEFVCFDPFNLTALEIYYRKHSSKQD
jgi:hypothetical protein